MNEHFPQNTPLSALKQFVYSIPGDAGVTFRTSVLLNMIGDSESVRQLVNAKTQGDRRAYMESLVTTLFDELRDSLDYIPHVIKLRAIVDYEVWVATDVDQTARRQRMAERMAAKPEFAEVMRGIQQGAANMLAEVLPRVANWQEMVSIGVLSNAALQSFQTGYLMDARPN